MQKIQYLVSSEVVSTMESIAKFLEGKGADGWILVSMANMQGDRCLFIFYRVKAEETK